MNHKKTLFTLAITVLLVIVVFCMYQSLKAPDAEMPIRVFTAKEMKDAEDKLTAPQNKSLLSAKDEQAALKKLTPSH